MNKNDLETWVTKLGMAWSKRDPKAAAYLFSKKCKYYESVFEKPCKSWDDISRLWLPILDNQKDVTFKFDTLSISDNIGIVNWKVTRTLIPSSEKQLIDGIFQISLDENALCTYFKQWRSVKKL